jgi:hypothetical protein
MYILLALFLPFITPSEENDHLIFSRIKENLQMIEALEEGDVSQEDRKDLRQPFIQEIGQIISFYLLPARLSSDERPLVLVQHILQSLRGLSIEYSKQGLEMVHSDIVKLQEYISRTQMYEKPLRGYRSKRGNVRANCKKIDHRSRQVRVR